MHRFRWRLYFRKLRMKLYPLCNTLVQVINKSACFFLLGICLLCFVWWIRAGEPLCDGELIQKQLCLDYKERRVAGHSCKDLCSDEYHLSGCDSNRGSLESVRGYQVLVHGSRIGVTAFYSDAAIPLKEGTLFALFSKMLRRSLHLHLGKDVDINSLSQRLLKAFDFNSNSDLDYGEANSLWKLLHQPHFLSNFILQDTDVVPKLNGTCGGLSLWSDYDRRHASPLYSRAAWWPFSLFYSNAYQITLPNWNRRAKIVLSLFEFAEDLYETQGVRFHLCNISSENLFYYNKQFEICVSYRTGLMSSSQIQSALSNRTCLHDRDCVYSSQCSTRCHPSTHACTSTLVRPTVVSICDIVEEYLMFDVPKALEKDLVQLMRRCQGLSWYSSSIDIQHSILLLNVKKLLWSHLQNIKL